LKLALTRFVIKHDETEGIILDVDAIDPVWGLKHLYGLYMYNDATPKDFIGLEKVQQIVTEAGPGMSGGVGMIKCDKPDFDAMLSTLKQSSISTPGQRGEYPTAFTPFVLTGIPNNDVVEHCNKSYQQLLVSSGLESSRARGGAFEDATATTAPLQGASIGNLSYGANLPF